MSLNFNCMQPNDATDNACIADWLPKCTILQICLYIEQRWVRLSVCELAISCVT